MRVLIPTGSPSYASPRGRQVACDSSRGMSWWCDDDDDAANARNDFDKFVSEAARPGYAFTLVAVEGLFRRLYDK